MNNYISNYLQLKVEKYFKYFINNKILINDLLSVIYYGFENMIDILISNIQELMYNDITDLLLDHNYDLLYITYINSNFFLDNHSLSEEDSIKLLYKCNIISKLLIYKFVIPPRSYTKSFIRLNFNTNTYYQNDYIKNKIQKKIDYLLSIIQPEQRTNEWYIFRNSTLTASNIYKIFVSEYTQSQLIIEKSQPINIEKYKYTNINSPMHWGQKYEPVSTMYYEYINDIKVTEFGCIQHDKYSFLAASPDGIVCERSSELFGRMLEIKNVVSRVITGIPKMEYWIQMQLQMEVCQLNECDFLETKFIEYTDEEEYLLDLSNGNVKYTGVIAHFVKDDNPVYYYCDFNSSIEKQNIWKKNIIDENIDIEFVRFIFWKLEYISCILVLRNKIWFKSVLPNIQRFWDILQEEKNNGSYKERLSKKPKIEYKHELSDQGCLIDISGL